MEIVICVVTRFSKYNRVQPSSYLVSIFESNTIACWCGFERMSEMSVEMPYEMYEELLECCSNGFA